MSRCLLNFLKGRRWETYYHIFQRVWFAVWTRMKSEVILLKNDPSPSIGGSYTFLHKILQAVPKSLQATSTAPLFSGENPWCLERNWRGTQQTNKEIEKTGNNIATACIPNGQHRKTLTSWQHWGCHEVTASFILHGFWWSGQGSGGFALTPRMTWQHAFSGEDCISALRKLIQGADRRVGIPTSGNLPLLMEDTANLQATCRNQCKGRTITGFKNWREDTQWGGHALKRDTLALHQKVFPNNHQWASDHTFRNGAPRPAVQKADWDFFIFLVISKLAHHHTIHITPKAATSRITPISSLPPPPSCPPVSVKSLWGCGEVMGGKVATIKTKQRNTQNPTT